MITFDMTTILTEWFGIQVTSLIGLIAVDVLLAIALALKTETFDWKKLLDFYTHMIVPYLIGWAAFNVLAKMVSPLVLPAEAAKVVSDGLAGIAWAAIVVSLVGRIYENGKAIYGEFFPAK